MKLTAKKLSRTHRVLVYGEPKSGKTELAARLAEKYNVLLFDLENGYETLLKLPTELAAHTVTARVKQANDRIPAVVFKAPNSLPLPETIYMLAVLVEYFNDVHV